MKNISAIPNVSEIIFGIKKRLDILIVESRKTNLELKILNSKNREG